MVSIDKLRTALEVQEADELDYLVELEQRAVAHVERETGHYFGPLEEITEYLQGTGTRNLWLSDFPVVDEETPVTVVDVDEGDYVVRGRKLVRTSIWTHGAEYAATYTRGYTSTAETPGEETPTDDIHAPAEIRGVVEWLVAYWYEERLPAAAVEMEPLPMHAAGVLAGWSRSVYA